MFKLNNKHIRMITFDVVKVVFYSNIGCRNLIYSLLLLKIFFSCLWHVFIFIDIIESVSKIKKW